MWSEKQSFEGKNRNRKLIERGRSERRKHFFFSFMQAETVEIVGKQVKNSRLFQEHKNALTAH